MNLISFGKSLDNTCKVMASLYQENWSLFNIPTFHIKKVDDLCPSVPNSGTKIHTIRTV